MKHSEVVASVEAALKLLEPQYVGRWSGAILFNRPKGTQIEVYFAGREYEMPDPNVYPLDPEVAKLMIREHLVEGIPKWGYTSSTEYHLSPAGKQRLREIHDAEKKEAKQQPTGD